MNMRRAFVQGNSLAVHIGDWSNLPDESPVLVLSMDGIAVNMKTALLLAFAGACLVLCLFWGLRKVLMKMSRCALCACGWRSGVFRQLCCCLRGAVLAGCAMSYRVISRVLSLCRRKAKRKLRQV